MAHGSTIFLDELLSMPADLQAKLLRALQDRRVRRLGSLKETPVDVKIISSLNQDPRSAIQEGKLRMDLYYRLGVVIVKLPALRQRLDTMEELTEHFIRKYNTRLGTNVQSISQQVKELFNAYHWPGNIRELEHLIEGAMNMAGQDDVIGLQHFEPGLDCLERTDAVCTDPAITLMSQSDPPATKEDTVLLENFPQTQKQREKAAIKVAMTDTGRQRHPGRSKAWDLPPGPPLQAEEIRLPTCRIHEVIPQEPTYFCRLSYFFRQNRKKIVTSDLKPPRPRNSPKRRFYKSPNYFQRLTLAVGLFT